VGSRDINASVVRANIGAFVAAAFIPFEPNAAAASAHCRGFCAEAGLFW
jgi:hypothetical protein